MGLLLALTLFQHLIDGFHNCDLRGLVADLLNVTTEQCTASQMTYDLRRPTSRGKIQFQWRVPWQPPDIRIAYDFESSQPI